MKKISSATIEFFANAIENSKDIFEIVNNPIKTIEKKNLTKKLQSDIETIRNQRDKVFDGSNPRVEQEIVDFANAVIIRGGKYLENWHKNPAKIANEINFKLTQEAEKAINKIEFEQIAETVKIVKGPKEKALFIPIIIIIVCVLIPTPAYRSTLVIDNSSKPKI